MMERALAGEFWGGWRRLWYAVSPEQVRRVFEEDSFYTNSKLVAYHRKWENHPWEPRLWRRGERGVVENPTEEATPRWAVDGPFLVRSPAGEWACLRKSYYWIDEERDGHLWEYYAAESGRTVFERAFCSGQFCWPPFFCGAKKGRPRRRQAGVTLYLHFEVVSGVVLGLETNETRRREGAMTAFAFPEVAPEIEIVRAPQDRPARGGDERGRGLPRPVGAGRATAWAYYKWPTRALDIGNIGWVAGTRTYRRRPCLEVMERAMTGETRGSWRRLLYEVSAEQVHHVFMEDSLYLEGENIGCTRRRLDDPEEPRVWRVGGRGTVAHEDWTTHWSVDGPFVVRSAAGEWECLRKSFWEITERSLRWPVGVLCRGERTGGVGAGFPQRAGTSPAPFQECEGEAAAKARGTSVLWSL